MLKSMSDNKVMELSVEDRDVVYGKEAVKLMMLQPLNMFVPLDIKVLHKTPSHEDERAE